MGQPRYCTLHNILETKDRPCHLCTRDGLLAMRKASKYVLNMIEYYENYEPIVV